MLILNSDIMRKSIILIFTCTLFIYSSYAQKADREVMQAFESPGIMDDLWFGGNLLLNFSGNGNYNIFQLGVTPMVGYKLSDHFSVGPRLGVIYQNIRGEAIDQFTGEIRNENANLTEYVFGFFGRAKFFQTFFLHLEAEYRNTEYVLAQSGRLIYLPDEDKVWTIRESDFSPIAGLGYNSSIGSLWGYEMMIFYRFNIADDDPRSPFDLRFGVTYNF